VWGDCELPCLLSPNGVLTLLVWAPHWEEWDWRGPRSHLMVATDLFNDFFSVKQWTHCLIPYLISVLVRDTCRRHTLRRRSCEDRGRDWSHAGTHQESQALPIATKTWKKSGFSPIVSKGSVVMQNFDFCISGLQNDEKINTCCFMPPGNLLQQPQDPNTVSAKNWEHFVSFPKN
jgi:hypothetical protein